MRRPVQLRYLVAALGMMLASAAAPAERELDVNGARLHVELVGHGPPLLLLHGGMQFFENGFAGQRDYFAATRTVIGIDQRAHGRSPDGPWELSYQQMADDTAAVLERLRVGPVDVIGHSDGANVALILARDHPELVRRMIVSGANLRSGRTEAEYRELRSWSDARIRSTLEALSARMPPSFRADYGRISPDGPEHWFTALRKCWLMWQRPVVIDPADLTKIRASVMVMAGDRDFTSLEETAEIFRGLPRAQLFIVPGTGHGTFQQKPAMLNPVMRAFLDAPEDAPERAN